MSSLARDWNWCNDQATLEVEINNIRKDILGCRRYIRYVEFIKLAEILLVILSLHTIS